MIRKLVRVISSAHSLYFFIFCVGPQFYEILLEICSLPLLLFLLLIKYARNPLGVATEEGTG